MKKNKSIINFILIILVEVILFGILTGFFVENIIGEVGSPNITVQTLVNISAVAPEVIYLEVNDLNDITLNANSTVSVECVALLRDYNNDSFLNNLSAKIFRTTSLYSDPDDNNSHYTNNTCIIDTTYGSFNGIPDDEYHALGNCTFDLWYYSDPNEWNCTMNVNNTFNYTHSNSTNTSVSELIAIDMPDTISYGTVNATYMSGENITNISNVGNVALNLSLKGWAIDEDDGNAMNCTYGTIKNITIEHEKYNLSASNPGELILAQAEINYTNLTGSSVIEQFSLDYRRQDSYNDATNASYWRIYVPAGVAGTCEGNIQFGATQSEAD
ncbi:hypothetical protein GOV12_06610 [Candidatus Pacearchaeota archaeon]|nr:hypothetical protein [Candidatus Pacearchaeota archaeon]